MKKENILSISIVVFLILGCNTPATPSIDQSPTPRIQPSLPPLPSKTAMVEEKERGKKEEEQEQKTPTSTPEPPLRTNGPYFAYFRSIGQVDQFVLMDMDARGKKVIDWPMGAVEALPNKEQDLNMNLVSPDGHWMAFYTGSAGSYGKEMPAPGTSDLTLNLLDLESGKQQVLTPLLSNDYPNNFVEAAKQLNDPYVTSVSLYGSFLIGITTSLAWSPDGRYLAFAGQMDGLSSDLYLYSLKTKTIQRLSSGAEELQSIDWSPDGKWILHGSVSQIGAGTEYNYYAAAADGSSILNLSYGFEAGWINSHQFLEYHSQNGLGNYGLRLADVNTGSIKTLWDGSFHDYQLDPSREWLVLFAFTSAIPPHDEEPDFVPGLQLINLKAFTKIQNPDPLPNPPNTFLRADDGKIIPLNLNAPNLNGEMIIASPDMKYWALIGDQKMKIYSSELVLIKEFPIPTSDANLRDLTWRPDSSGCFLIYGQDIYSMNISDGDFNLIESNLIDGYRSRYKWINTQ